MSLCSSPPYIVLTPALGLQIAGMNPKNTRHFLEKLGKAEASKVYVICPEQKEKSYLLCSISKVCCLPTHSPKRNTVVRSNQAKKRDNPDSYKGTLLANESSALAMSE
jgi:hypothetical protein